MGAFQLIENKQFQKFCELYERKSHLRATTADYADLMPGNYMRALLGAKKIEKDIEKSLASKSFPTQFSNCGFSPGSV